MIAVAALGALVMFGAGVAMTCRCLADIPPRHTMERLEWRGWMAPALFYILLAIAGAYALWSEP